jgi:aryl-alcohol dehydrogenase-like predicted oxidoreductase
MTHELFPDEIVDLVSDSRIERLRDEQDVMDLAARLAQAFGAGQMQVAIAAALTQRRWDTPVP